MIFTPDQQRAANELLRVFRPGGKIGLANWTSKGSLFSFKIIRPDGVGIWKMQIDLIDACSGPVQRRCRFAAEGEHRHRRFPNFP
jgi:hypothetical protein